MPYVQRIGARIHYSVEGTGRPLVLLHGLSSDSTVWRYAGYVDDLARDHLLLLIDVRGHGLSDAPIEQRAYEMRELVGDVLAVADAVGVDQFAIWGWSLGGWVAWATVDAVAERVRAFISSGEFQPQQETSDEPWEEFDRWLRQPVARDGMPAAIERFEEWDRSTLPDWLREIHLRFDPDVFLRFNTRESWRTGIVDLSAIEAPGLLISGEFEDEEGLTHDVARQLRSGESHVFPALGHVGAFLRGDLTIPIARKFLDRHFPWP